MTSPTSTDEGVQMPCYVHGVVEPDEGAFLVCFECGHVYSTAGSLRRDYRREYWKVARDDRFGRIPLVRRLWRVRECLAAEYWDAAQAIEDSHGESDDSLSTAIWDGCRSSQSAPCVVDDPRTIAIAAYRHLATQITAQEGR